MKARSLLLPLALLAALGSGAAALRKKDVELPEIDLDLDDVNPLNYRRTLMGYYAIEDTSYTRQAVQAWLAEQDIPAPERLRGGGGGMTASWGRLLLDAGGSGMGDTQTTGGKQYSFGGGQGYFAVGVALVKRRTLRIYPLIGIGGLGGGLDVKDGAAGVQAGRGKGSGWGAGLWTTGFGIDFVPGIWRLGLLFGLRVGYNYGLISAQVGDGRNIHPPTGPYVRLVIGWGIR